MANKNKKAFTLVELLAVIVVLAVILVIAVPSIMRTITKSRKGSLAASAQLIASAAESEKAANDVLGIVEEIKCSDVAQLTEDDYQSCKIKFDSNGKAKVTIIGKGKFEGMNVCRGTKENAEASYEECLDPINFSTDSWKIIIEAVKSGDYPYVVGDTRPITLGTLGEHTLRIANTTPCDGTLASQTACGFVIEFADIITTHNMNDTRINVGGWPASQMRTYLNTTIYNVLEEELRNGIKTTKVVSGHGNGDETGTLENNNFYSEDKLYLLSPEEIYGISFAESYDTSIGTSRQLDWYSDNGVSTLNYSSTIKNNSAGNASSWWLRSTRFNNTDSFYFVMSSGGWYGSAANLTDGVSPAFRLG